MVKLFNIDNFKCNVTKYMFIITFIIIVITIVISLSSLAVSNIYSYITISKAVDITNEANTYKANVNNDSINKAHKLASEITADAAINPKNLIKKRDDKIALDILTAAKFINSTSSDLKCQNAIYAVLDRNAKKQDTTISQVKKYFASNIAISRDTNRTDIKSVDNIKIEPSKNAKLPKQTIEAITLYYKGTDYSNGATIYYDLENFDTIPKEKTVTAVFGSYIFKK